MGEPHPDGTLRCSRRRFISCRAPPRPSLEEVCHGSEEVCHGSLTDEVSHGSLPERATADSPSWAAALPPPHSRFAAVLKAGHHMLPESPVLIVAASIPAALPGVRRTARYFPPNRRRIESVQTVAGIARTLSAAGLSNVRHQKRCRDVGYADSDRRYGRLVAATAWKAWACGPRRSMNVSAAAGHPEQSVLSPGSDCTQSPRASAGINLSTNCGEP